MKRLKALGRALLFPPLPLRLALIPLATVLLVYGLTQAAPASLPAILAYVLSAYTLTVLLMGFPALLAWGRRIKRENRTLRRWLEDAELRTRVNLRLSLAWNTAYALFHLGLGIRYAAFWYYTLFGYYLLLALLSYSLTAHRGAGEAAERRKYRLCGGALLLLNLALAAMIFLMVYEDRSFAHGPIVTIALAAYTFTALAVAIRNFIHYRKHTERWHKAAKATSLVAACVSMVTLTSTMLTTFGEKDAIPLRRPMLALLGAAVSLVIVAVALSMLVDGKKNQKQP